MRPRGENGEEENTAEQQRASGNRETEGVKNSKPLQVIAVDNTDCKKRTVHSHYQSFALERNLMVFLPVQKTAL